MNKHFDLIPSSSALDMQKIFISVTSICFNDYTISETYVN